MEVHTLFMKCMLSLVQDSAHMSPGALLPFHWPRTDLDQLLCIRYKCYGSLKSSFYAFVVL